MACQKGVSYLRSQGRSNALLHCVQESLGFRSVSSANDFVDGCAWAREAIKLSETEYSSAVVYFDLFLAAFFRRPFWRCLRTGTPSVNAPGTSLSTFERKECFGGCCSGDAILLSKWGNCKPPLSGSDLLESKRFGELALVRIDWLRSE